MISVQIKGVRELQDRLDAIGDLSGAMRDLALDAVGEQKKLAPTKTTNLRHTIHIGQIRARSAETIASANYAAYVEFGTRPHEIRPRNKRVLAWKDPNGNRVYKGARYRVTRRVMHPGTRKQPYMVPGAQAAIRNVGLADSLIARWNRAA